MDLPEKKSLIILNYHQVSEDKNHESILAICKKNLSEQLKVVRSSKVPLFSLDKVCKKEMPATFSIAVTVDDGNLSDYEVMRPLLKEYGLPATFFLLTGKIGSPGYMTWDQVRELRAEGFDIGSHGISHDILTRKSAELQKEELQKSKEDLEKELGTEVCSFAFPYGRYDETLLALAKEVGYKAVYSTGLKINFIEDNNYLLFRWNITNKTEAEMLQQVLNSKGIISNAFDMQNRIKSIAGRLKNT